jgi:hypothetical protein
MISNDLDNRSFNIIIMWHFVRQVFKFEENLIQFHTLNFR